MPEALVTYIGEAVLEYLGEVAFEAFVTAAIYAPYVAVAASVYTMREQQRRAKNAYNNGLSDRYVMQRTATGQRSLVMGRVRVSGPITFLHSYGDNNTTLAMCLVLAGHECDAIEEIYFNDTPVILDGSGNVVGTKNIEHFSISGTTATFHLGAVGVNGTASAVATYDTGDVSLGVSMSGDGLTLSVTGGTSGKVGSVVVTYQPYEVVYTPTRIQDSHQQQTAGSSSGTFTVPSNCITASAVVVDIDSRGFQTVISFTRSGNVITYTGATAGHTVHLMYQAGTTYSRARITKHLGQPGQAADSSLLYSLPALWTSAHRGDGLCYLKIELDYDPSTFPSGIPNISAVVRGAKFYDPRTATTAWTDNPAIMMRGYYLHPLGAGRDSSEVNDASIIAAANVCDGSVTYTVGSHKQTRARYKASTVAAKDRRPQDVLTDIAHAMGGRWVVAGNQLTVKAGAFSSPVASINETWLHGGSGVSVQPRPNRADLTNSITGSFADEEQNWQSVAFPTVKADAYITADGAELQARVDYPAVTYSGQAQYLSACAIRYNRAGLTLRMSCNLRAFPLDVFDVVNVSLARFGWTNKTFEVIATSFTVEGLVELTLKEIDSSIWALDAAYLATDYATKTFLPSPWSLPVPVLGTPLSGTDYLLRQADGSVVSRIYVPITAITDQAVVQGGSIEVAYSRVSDPDQAWYSVTVPGDATGAFLSGVNDGAVYLIKARARNRLAEGAWCQQQAHKVVGKTALPADVVGLTLTALPDAIRGTRTPSTEADYDHTIYRYGTTFAAGTDVPCTSDASGFTWQSPSNGSYTIWAADVDTSGNIGDPVSASITFASSVPQGPTLAASSLIFSVPTSGSATPSSITLTVSAYQVLGSVSWSVVSGTATLTGSGATRSLAYSDMATDSVTIRVTEGSRTSNVTIVKVRQGATGSAGADGSNTAMVFLYRRSSTGLGGFSVPSSTLTYTFSSGLLSGASLDGWAQSVPDISAGQFLIVTQAIATAAGATDTIPSSEWTSPTILAQDGAAGVSGLNNAQVFIYQRSGSGAPSLPSATATYTFASAALTGLNNGWSASWPSGTGPVYISTATASSTGTTDTITAGEWASAQLAAQDGATGSTGAAGTNGINSASVFLYRRNNVGLSGFSVPSTTLTYTFATGVLSGTLDGWSQSVPDASAGKYLIVTQASALGSGSTDTIATGEWASPAVMAQDGADGAAGAAGAAGLNNATVYIYQRSGSGAPSLPSSTATYTFATAVLTGLNNGWSASWPTGTGTVYISAATASSAGTSDTIASGEWATPQVAAQDGATGATGATGAAGAAGTNGINTASVFLYRRNNVGLSGFSVPSTTLTYTFATGVLSGTLDGWSQTVPDASGGKYLIVTQATALGSGSTDTIASGEWASPSIMAQDGADGAAGATGATGAAGTQAAQAYLWQWSTTTPGDPSGFTTWTWSTASNGSYTGGNGWSTSVPSNPGTPGIKLWVVSKGVSAAATATTTSVGWSSGFAGPSVYSTNGNDGATGPTGATGATGAAGASGVQSASPTVYQWASSIPSGPSGAATYTWSTGGFGSAPSGWSLTPGTSPSAGFTLWAAVVQLTDTASNTTTSFNWTSANVRAVGYAGSNGSMGATGATGSTGQQGASARYAYQRIAGNPTPVSGTVTHTGDGLPTSSESNSAWGLNVSWSTSDPSPSSTNTLYQSDGIYDPATGNTVWTTPYVSSLKVGSLSAITANMGALTVNGTLTLTSGEILAGNYTSSSSWPSSGGGWSLGLNAMRMGNYYGTVGYVEIYADGSQVAFGKAGGPSLVWSSASGGSLTLAGATLSAATITGGVLQTASSGQRIVLNESGTNVARFYGNAGGGTELLAQIGAVSYGSAYTIGSFGSQTAGNGTVGVQGYSNSSTGVVGRSTSGVGVIGLSSSNSAITGSTTSSNGAIEGENLGSGAGVRGYSASGYAVRADGSFYASGAFGVNGSTPQTKYTFNSAATDLATVIALTNQIRAALIANGIGQ